MQKYKASIIIPVSNNCNILNYFIEHLKISLNIEQYQIIFVIDGPVDHHIKESLSRFSREFATISCYYLNKRSSYSYVNNYGRLFAESDLLIFMNTDIFIQENCLEIMIDSLNKNNVQAVQPMLIYPQNNTIQSTGHIFGDCHNRHALKGRELEYYLINIPAIRQALSLALCLIPANIFDEVNGFDEYYFNGWEGLDLTLKITQKGYRCWYESAAKAYHIEGGSREKFSSSQDLQAHHFWAEWGSKVECDIIDIIEKQLSQTKKCENYLVYNFSNYRSWNVILDSIGFTYESIINKTTLSQAEPINFFNVLSQQALTYPSPIIFLVTAFTSLKENALWIKYRKCNNDIFMDLSGNAGNLKDIVCGNL